MQASKNSQSAGLAAEARPSPRPFRAASAFLHVLGLASFAASFRFLSDFPTLINDSYGWHFQYLTIIALSLAAATFGIGLIADVVSSRRLFVVKNTLGVISTPLEVLVAILYWGIRSVDRRLVMPDWAVLPLHADIGFHALPAIFLVLDFMLLSPPWTITLLPSLAFTITFALGYWAWIEHCFSRNGWYPYPIFEVLAPPYRAVLFAGSAMAMTLSTLSLKWVHTRLKSRA